ncbi:MAG: trypsin-like peptidase domain-containing protein [Caldilineae bacterium]|nr:trypsin-like peptidase domain-containing protein [Chloroflexota bacterium]MCB9177197.1 trypsin-like peptidase domain-containing protein [Caldilineae bacterium]
MYRTLGVVAILAALVLSAAGIGATAGGMTAWWLVQHETALDRPAEVTPRGATGLSSAQLTASVTAEDAVLEVVRATRPAVVTVLNLRYARENPFAPIKIQPVGSGSGVIFDARGYIATNAHVVHDASALEVVFIDGRRAKAELVHFDAAYDVAVLKLPEGTELPAVAPLADSASLEPGMRVLAIGSPLGTDFINTVTTGIIAGLNRRVKEEGFDLRTFEYREYDVIDVPLIQTDAAINSGNSGGPLVDMRGEVVGLNTLIVRRDQSGGGNVEGFGFSIPSNVVRSLADEWIDGRPRAELGAEATDIDPELARESGMERALGAAVMKLAPGGAAMRAGLREGDVILAVNGQPLNLDRALADELWRYRAGDEIALTVDRFGEQLTLRVTLGAPAGSGGAASR